MPPAAHASVPAGAPVPYPVCVPALTDGVVALRAHRPEDVPRIVESCNDPDSMAFLALPRPYGEKEAHEWLASVRAGWEDPGGTREWVITDHGDLFLGSVNLHARSPGRAEVGFSIHPDSRGRGLVARAVRLLAARAFAEGAELVRWRSVAGNWASRRVAWACGFSTPVRVTGGTIHDARPVDAWHAALRAGEPMRPHTPWWVAPVLEGRRARLRDARESDESQLPDHPDEVRAGGRVGGSSSRGEYAAWLLEGRERAAAGAGLRWAIADPVSDALVGGVQIDLAAEWSTPTAGAVAVWLRDEEGDEAVRREALDLAVTHAVSAVADGGMGLPRLVARADAAEPASIGALYAAGLRRTGIERVPGAGVDAEATERWCFELLADDDREAQRVRPLASPVIETPRLRLRPWRASDAPDPADDPDHAALRFMPAGAQPRHGEFAAWLARQQRLHLAGAAVGWCVADRDTDRALGSVQLFRRGELAIEHDAELGYWVFPSARGRRLIGEALPPVLDHAFAPHAAGGLGLARVHAQSDLDNYASQAVLRRAGLREWGRAREAWKRADGTLVGGVHMELLATDPR